MLRWIDWTWNCMSAARWDSRAKTSAIAFMSPPMRWICTNARTTARPIRPSTNPKARPNRRPIFKDFNMQSPGIKDPPKGLTPRHRTPGPSG